MSNTSTQRRLSFRNPFRTPSLTPNPTGTSTTSSAPSYHTALPSSHTLLLPTPTGMSTTSSAPSYYTAVESNVHSDDEDTPEVLPELTPRIPSRNLSHLSLDDIPECPPPAYSLTPDIDDGETFLIQDPSEPFQPEPEPEPSVQPPPPSPPPSPPGSFRERPLSPLSGFEAPPSPTAPLQQEPLYAPPPGPPPPAGFVRQQPRYAPPPGAPPPPPHRPQATSTSSGAGSTASPASYGHPTNTPMPGRPLLRNGRTLVYPESYLCPKCKNTGYKNYDPSHPCRKCWDRFGKPFSAILASSPWGDQSSSQSQHGRTFQQPLPPSNPPQAVFAPVHPTPPPPPPPALRVPPLFPPAPGLFAPPRIPPPRTGPMVMPYGAAPPPGAAVVMPGDSRIGGRLCPRCGGCGTTPFLIFDELPCERCGGVGRLFNRPLQNGLWNKHGMDPRVGAQGINGWSRRF